MKNASKSVAWSVLAVLGVLLAACAGGPDETPGQAVASAADALEGDLCRLAEEGRIPGLAAALIVQGELRWIGACGEADLGKRVPMTPDTLLNIGSVSKTFTNAAVLQLWERGRIDLEAEVSGYLPFPVRHPRYPDRPMTIRHLLTHTAGLADGPSYGETYACGDPAVSLRDWLEGYVTPGGAYWSEENFMETGPGEARSYSNVGFGLLGLVVEAVDGRSFADYTRDEIFRPLGMDRTAWYLDRIDAAEHAVPYLWLEPDGELEAEDLRLLPEGDVPTETFVPYCLYSFYNYPDGLVRTSVRQLARFVLAHLGGGEVEGARVLAEATVEAMWRAQIPEEVWEEGRVQGLTWRATTSEKLGFVWGHGGADPGIRAQVLYRPADEVAVVVLANRLVVAELGPILVRLFGEGAEQAASSVPDVSSPRPSR